MTLTDALYTPAQVRDLESRAATQGCSGFELMQRAGAALLNALRAHWPQAQRVAVVCGGGNNGGDGYVLASLAKAAGYTVTLLAAAAPEQLQGDAKLAHEAALAAALSVKPFAESELAAAELIVDAFVGTGTRLPLQLQASAVVRAINAAARPVLSVDLPSGLDGYSGAGQEVVLATVTLSLVAFKSGQLMGEGPVCCGTLELANLELDLSAVRPALLRQDDEVINQALPPRRRPAHKGSFGSVLVIGGGEGMPGAVRLAAESALRAGGGRVTVGSLPAHLTAIVAPRPELMFLSLTDAVPLAAALPQASVVAIGPGLGQSDWARALLLRVLAQPRSGQWLVIDADALNLLATVPQVQRRSDWVLTPHPGEAARLLGITADAVQADRLAAVQNLQRRYGGTVVLKGSGTLVAGERQVPVLCTRGNPAMASAGMGDVLTGAVAGILAQCRDPWLAACAGVQAHGRAGDALAMGGDRSLLAGDLALALGAAIGP